MATETQTNPRSRLARLGLGLVRRVSTSSSTGSRSPHPDSGSVSAKALVEDWYLPYTGPIETPKDQDRDHDRVRDRERRRDSWGDVVDERDDFDGGGDHYDTGRSYYDNGSSRRAQRYDENGDGVGRGRPRTRVLSGVSSRMTMSSGTVDPTRKSLVSPRSPRLRATAHPPRLPTPSFVSLDAVGGVGESPVPVQRGTSDRDVGGGGAFNRLSIASFFTFGQGSKHGNDPPSASPSKNHFASTNDYYTSTNDYYAPPRPSTSTQGHHSSYQSKPPSVRMRERDDQPVIFGSTPLQRQNSASSHRSARYYTQTSKSTARPGTAPSDRHHAYAYTRDEPDELISPFSSSYQNGPSQQHHQHPYAYAFPASSSQPVVVSNSNPTIRLLTPKIQPVPQHLKPTRTPNRLIKTSVSTPNLRSISGQQQQPQQQQHQQAPYPAGIPRGVDRLLSPETWCDALVLPRPRFKTKLSLGENGHGHAPSAWPPNGVTGGGGSGRIVSPPGSPIWGPSGTVSSARGAGWPMTLAQEREREHGETVAFGSSPSQQQLQQQQQQLQTVSDNLRPVVVSRPRGNTLPLSVVEEVSGTGSGNGSRSGSGFGLANGSGNGNGSTPKRYSKDDLALPSPVPSLAGVLRDGERLANDRKAWQAQATQSFMNSRSRSLSRTHTKSLSKAQSLRVKPNVNAAGVTNSFDFLAARTLHGHQGISPAVSLPSSKGSAQSHSIGAAGTSSSLSQKSHSRNHSRKSSLGSNIRGHARNDSWDTGNTGNLNDKAAGLEGALRSDGTKVIRLGDQLRADERQEQNGNVVLIGQRNPTLLASTSLGLVSNHNQNGLLGGRVDGPSPTPSGTASGEGVGIAITSPSPADERGRSSHDQEPILMPSHPYAHGATYSVDLRPVAVEPVYHPGAKYAGPHPSSPKVDVGMLPSAANDLAIRHRLPPRANMPHLFAQPSHPYATALSEPRGALEPVGSSASQLTPQSPNSRMFAEVGPGQVREIRPEDIQYSPTSSTLAAIAQAHASNRFSDSLGVEEALSYYGYGSEARASIYDANGADIEADPSGEVERVDPSNDYPPQIPSWRVRQEPVKFGTSQQSDAPSSVLNESESDLDPSSSNSKAKQLPPAMLLRTHSNNSFPGSGSARSSAQTSPRELGSIDNLDGFLDLFYRPGHSQTPSGDYGKELRSREPSGSQSLGQNTPSSRGGSALSRLTRQLSEDLGDYPLDSSLLETIDGGSPMRGARFGGLRGDRPPEMEHDPNIVLSQALDSPPGTTLPLRFAGEKGASSSHLVISNVPEDVHSSGASSIMDPVPSSESPIELFRVGAVEAVTTPKPEGNDYRASATLSLVLDEFDAQSGIEIPHREHGGSDGRTTVRDSLQPRDTIDLARESYMTSDTAFSRISGLSDFPAPPTLNAITPSADYQSPARLSPVVDEGHGSQETAGYHGVAPVHDSTSRSIPQANHTDLSRASYMTSDTATTRMSGLSDFPVPPTQSQMNHISRVEVDVSHSPVDREHSGTFRLSPIIDERRKSQESLEGSGDASPQSETLHKNLSRHSYRTVDTANSGMSGLSDFPPPPAHSEMPAHASILQSYFADTGTSGQQLDDSTEMPERLAKLSRNHSRRTTFGVEPADVLLPSEP